MSLVLRSTSDFLILICFHINLGSFKMYSFFVCTQSHYEFYFFFPNPQACFSRLGNYWTHMVAALLTHKCCLWLDSYLLSLLDWGGSLRFLVPVKRFHNEWSLHFINTFPASIEMGFSLSSDKALNYIDFLALNHPCFPGINPLHHDILAFLYNLANFCLGFFLFAIVKETFP